MKYYICFFVLMSFCELSTAQQVKKIENISISTSCKMSFAGQNGSLKHYSCAADNTEKYLFGISVDTFEGYEVQANVDTFLSQVKSNAINSGASNVRQIFLGKTKAVQYQEKINGDGMIMKGMFTIFIWRNHIYSLNVMTNFENNHLQKEVDKVLNSSTFH